MDEVVYYFDREKNDEDIVSFKDSVLLMPTGIYDCSGREIFEGDVISYQENSFTYKKTAEIIYENGCFITKQLFPKNLELKSFKKRILLLMTLKIYYVLLHHLYPNQLRLLVIFLLIN